MSRSTLHVGDCREALRTLAAESAHCAVTSPPYWGLRDYGVAGQLGLEATPEEYVARMVEVFREVRRVLRSDGTLWLNMGDCYATGAGKVGDCPGGGEQGEQGERWKERGPARKQVPDAKDPCAGVPTYKPNRMPIPGLKPKDLVGMPWRVAFALQEDGWTLRSEIIWSKENPMPESVTDRPTKAHEQLFLLSKAKWRGSDRGRFAHISDEDARWLALLVDTEGCIVVRRGRHDGRSDTFAPQVSVGTTSRALMERVVAICEHGTILQRPGKNAPMWYWQLACGIARDFIYRIYPFLIVKSRQARIAIHVDSLTYHRGGQRDERKRRSDAENIVLISMWERARACNHFGDPNLSDVPEPEYGRWDSARYYYDAEAIREPHTTAGAERNTGVGARNRDNTKQGADPMYRTRPGSRPLDYFGHLNGRNKRTVWTIATAPFPGAHFATFPPALVAPCVKAGTSERGACPACGAPWRREVEPSAEYAKYLGRGYHDHEHSAERGMMSNRGVNMQNKMLAEGITAAQYITKGWAPTCACPAAEPIPCVVLDPFSGAGTTGLVACGLGRDFVGVELNPEYAEMARRRIVNETPGVMVGGVTPRALAADDALPLFREAQP